MENAQQALLQQAKDAIYAYTFGMDTNNWGYAVSKFAPEIEVDYSQVGAVKGKVTRLELQLFLQQLLEKPNLNIHTAISQVFASPQNSAEFIAYYSVRHDKGDLGKAEHFSVFGWYIYQLEAGLIKTLTIHVQAIEGNPNILA